MNIRLSRAYSVEIPCGTNIGPGFLIVHACGIVIHRETTIGSNCWIHQFTSIGSNRQTPATIGNNVFIGPNVSIVNDVKIGNNVKIGAGSVVINDVPDNATTVGNPNRVILH